MFAELTNVSYMYLLSAKNILKAKCILGMRYAIISTFLCNFCLFLVNNRCMFHGLDICVWL